MPDRLAEVVQADIPPSHPPSFQPVSSFAWRLEELLLAKGLGHDLVAAKGKEKEKRVGWVCGWWVKAKSRQTGESKGGCPRLRTGHASGAARERLEERKGRLATCPSAAVTRNLTSLALPMSNVFPDQVQPRPLVKGRSRKVAWAGREDGRREGWSGLR